MDQYQVKRTKQTDGGDGPTIIDAMRVLAFSTELGADADALAARTGIDVDVICKIADRMRDQGLWNGNTADCSEWWDGSGQFDAQTFFAQAKLAIGEARRVKTSVGYEYVPTGQELQ